MLYYIKDSAVACGCLEELKIDPVTTRAYTPCLDITVIARMLQKEITIKMKVGVILRQQLAIQTDRFIETLDESCDPATGSQMYI